MGTLPLLNRLSVGDILKRALTGHPLYGQLLSHRGENWGRMFHCCWEREGARHSSEVTSVTTHRPNPISCPFIVIIIIIEHACMCEINVCAFAWKGQRTTSLSLDTAHLGFIFILFYFCFCFLRQGLLMAWNLLRDPLVSAFLVLKSQMHATLPGLGCGFWGANSGPCTVSTSLI